MNDSRVGKIRQLRDAGLTWREVAAQVGLSGTRCQQLAKGAGESEKRATAHPAASGDASSGGFDLLSTRRAICAHKVRGELVPESLRIHDHLSLNRLARLIRKEMAEAGAAPSEVEAYVEKHVTRT